MVVGADYDGCAVQWYPLEGCKHGDIRVKAAWLSLSSLAADVEREEWQAEWKQVVTTNHIF